jgi:hypothetical protein
MNLSDTRNSKLLKLNLRPFISDNECFRSGIEYSSKKRGSLLKVPTYALRAAMIKDHIKFNISKYDRWE